MWNRTAEHAADVVDAGATGGDSSGGGDATPTSSSRRPPTTPRHDRCGSATTASSPVRRRRRRSSRRRRCRRTGSPSSPTPAAPRAGRSSTCPSPVAAPAPRAARCVMLAGGDEADARGDRRRARGDLVGRFATSARSAAARGSSSCSTPCRRSTSSASARRWRWRGPPVSIPTTSGRPRRAARWTGHHRWPGPPTSSPRSGRTSPWRWALKDLRYAAAMAGDVPAPMLDVAVARLADAAATGLGDRDWTVVRRLARTLRDGAA